MLSSPKASHSGYDTHTKMTVNTTKHYKTKSNWTISYFMVLKTTEIYRRTSKAKVPTFSFKYRTSTKVTQANSVSHPDQTSIGMCPENQCHPAAY